jgi:hypothetical protein
LEKCALRPAEDQEEPIELACEVQARRTGVYVMADEEWAAVREGLEACRGEFVPDEEMDAFWKKIGVPRALGDIDRIYKRGDRMLE